MAADRFAAFHDVRHFPEGTRTAEDAAAAIGCEVGQICKSLVFRVGDEALLVVTSGVNRVDTARFGARKADADFVREATGFSIGGVPPFGHRQRIETIVDEDLLQDFNVKYVGALRCARAAIPYLKQQGWGRIINISGTNARNAGNLSGGARNGSLVHFTKTLAVQLGRFGITVNCIHPGTTRTERTPRLLGARAAELGISVDDVEKRDFAHDSPRGNAIGRMVDASEIAYLAVFLASDKAWAVTGELVVATGGAGRAVYY